MPRFQIKNTAFLGCKLAIMPYKKKFKTIKLEQRNKAAWVILSRPEVRNAFNEVMIAEITEAFFFLCSQANLRVVVVTGEGDSFCSGADLSWMREVLDYTYDENMADSQRLADMMHVISICPFPTIARVNGPAIGGGCGIVAACDIAVASDKAFFSFAEVKLGIVPAVISPYVLRKMGDRYTREYFLTGDKFSSEKAQMAGLVNKVVEEQELDTTINIYIEKFMACAPNALERSKQLLLKVPGLTEPELSKYTSELITELRISDEGQEGMKAFFEKRKPKWMK
jgi:methylglutaconyl-CoA hydratase